MPWPNKEDRLEVDNSFDKIKAIKKGQVTYLFYKRFHTMWKDKPRYDTIHYVGLLRERPELDKVTWEIATSCLFKGMTKSEISQCRNDAHHQMERKYFDPYEDKKLQENGDVE